MAPSKAEPKLEKAMPLQEVALSPNGRSLFWKTQKKKTRQVTTKNVKKKKIEFLNFQKENTSRGGENTSNTLLNTASSMLMSP